MRLLLQLFSPNLPGDDVHAELLDANLMHLGHLLFLNLLPELHTFQFLQVTLQLAVVDLGFDGSVIAEAVKAHHLQILRIRPVDFSPPELFEQIAELNKDPKPAATPSGSVTCSSTF